MRTAAPTATATMTASNHHQYQHHSGLKYVDHTYRDFSRFVDDGGQLIKHKKSTNNFPARLHRILSDGRHAHVITWMPHGRAWKIIDKERLISDVLPHYYCCKKYESFSRQLNGWGFKRLHQSGPDYGCYYHECFLRDLPKLTCLIRRLPANLGKSTPFAEGEPNFYKISERFPLPPLDLPSGSNGHTNTNINNASAAKARAISTDSSAVLSSAAPSASSHQRRAMSAVMSQDMSQHLLRQVYGHLGPGNNASLGGTGTGPPPVSHGTFSANNDAGGYHFPSHAFTQPQSEMSSNFISPSYYANECVGGQFNRYHSNQDQLFPEFTQPSDIQGQYQPSSLPLQCGSFYQDCGIISSGNGTNFVGIGTNNVGGPGNVSADLEPIPLARSKSNPNNQVAPQVN